MSGGQCWRLGVGVFDSPIFLKACDFVLLNCVSRAGWPRRSRLRETGIRGFLASERTSVPKIAQGTPRQTLQLWATRPWSRASRVLESPYNTGRQHATFWLSSEPWSRSDDWVDAPNHVPEIARSMELIRFIYLPFQHGYLLWSCEYYTQAYVRAS